MLRQKNGWKVKGNKFVTVNCLCLTGLGISILLGDPLGPCIGRLRKLSTINALQPFRYCSAGGWQESQYELFRF
jgi:hypothetical protein